MFLSMKAANTATRFTQTLDITSNAIVNALHDGQLKLQRGQWLSQGGKTVRFVKANKHTVWVSRSAEQFKILCGNA